MNFKTTLALMILIAAGVSLAWFGPSLPTRGKRPGATQVIDQGSQSVLNQLTPKTLLKIEIHRGDRATVFERGKIIHGNGIHKPGVTMPERFSLGPWTLPGRWPVRRAEVNELVDLLGNLR